MSNESLSDYRKNVLDIEQESFSSYALLERIIERSKQIIEYDEMVKSCLVINYYRVGIKCDIFSKLADISNFHYGCILFDKEKYNEKNPNNNFSPSSNKLLYTPSDEVLSPYFMMGIKKDNNYSERKEYDNADERYIVETLMAVDNPIRFFDGQEVVIPTQILTDNNGKLDKNKASATDKIRLIREYQNIVNEYNIDNNLNIFGDYFSLLMGEKNNDELKLSKK